MRTNNLYTFLLLMFVSATLNAQDLGCDGSRYKNDVFSAVKKTTVTYAPTVGPTGIAVNLQMDVYEPEGDVVPQRPAVVLAHGGSFLFGDRTMMERWCLLLAKKGYVAATISYRLYPFIVLGLPDSIDIFDTAVKAVGDMRAAVRYFREDAATANQFHVDPNHIYIGGYSAGAVTALHCSYMDSNDEIPPFLQTLIDNNGGFEGISGTVSNKTFSSSSKAVVNMSGGLYRNFWIDQNEVPIVSIHGTADATVPFVSGLAANIAYLEGSFKLHQRATDIGLWNNLHVVPGGGHTDIYDNAIYQPHLDTFWVNATNLLESLTCSSVGAFEPYTWENSWSLSPNPNPGISLKLSLPVELITADVQVSNLLGVAFYQQRNVGNGEAINMPDLPAGVYLVQITDPANPTKRFAAKRLIVE